MIVVQTFATGLLNNYTKEGIDEMLALHYMSCISIKKQLNKGDTFCLVTDTLGKEYTKNFPYDDIVTALDDYPYPRPIKMSAYKLYSIELFKNLDFVHFDNDVMLFKPIPLFKDTLVQSCESNFVEMVYHNKVKYYDWIFPDYVAEIKMNHNPGIFGFMANSKVRNIYYRTALSYSNKNIEFVENIESPIKKAQYKENMQDVYLFLEEGVLWYLLKKLKADLVEMVPNKYADHPNPWGVADGHRWGQVDWMISHTACYMNWREQKYVHLMNYHRLRTDWQIAWLPQEVLLEVYHDNKESVEKLLKNDLWSV